VKIEIDYIEATTETICGGYFIRVGDRYQDGLSSDEALGVIARLLLLPPENGLKWLRTAEEHAKYQEHFAPYKSPDYRADQLQLEDKSQKTWPNVQLR
jgi:hypothetical protein